MYRHAGHLVFSPSDLTTFWESAFASWMDRCSLDSPSQGAVKDEADATQALLAKKGLEHEANVLEDLERKGKGKSIARITTNDRDRATEETLAALKSGVDVIYQAYLTLAPFAGYADFLVRVEEPSKLGAFSYEVWDSKLAKQVKPYYVIQLCAYAEMLAEIQGIIPRHIAVVLGNGATQSLLTHEFSHYYRRVKQAFLEFHAKFDASVKLNPEKYRSFGRWEDEARQLMVATDSLTQLAGIHNRHVLALCGTGIATMASLAAFTGDQVAGVNATVLARLRRQCQLQIRSRGAAKPVYEVYDHSKYSGDKGLFMLPKATKDDVYFDMEGFPLIEGGLEYLWGAIHQVNRDWQFKDLWAHDHPQEKIAFETFIDWVHARWRQNPTMHVYHYAPYEISVIKRLMGRYGTREDKVDYLFRGKVFVDLYQIVKESLVVGTDSYSIKSVERLYRPARASDVKDGGASIVYYNDWLEQKDGPTWESSPILKAIRDYNKDDCDTMVELAEFLRAIQSKFGIAPSDHVQGDVDPEEVSPDNVANRALEASLIAVASTRPEAEVLGQLTGFYRREAKPAWWRYFERHRQRAEDLIDDQECLVNISKVGTSKTLHVYRFVEGREQKVSVDAKFEVHGCPGPKITVIDVNFQRGEVTLKLRKNAVVADGMSLVPVVDDFGRMLGKALDRFCAWWLTHQEDPSAVMSFLRRDKPRLAHSSVEAILAMEGDLTAKVTKIVGALDRSHLVIQGPPGSGKTTIAANLIKSMILAGKSVAISSNSHEAINLLLRRTTEHFGDVGTAARDELRVFKVQSDDTDEIFDGTGIQNYKKGSAVDYGAHAQLVGGTVFAFMGEDAKDQFDYLFVDEAGQVSVANLVVMGHAAKNIVLMGDQMQLSQPTQGTHPGDSGLSALDYLLGNLATVPKDMGVFLPTSYRMHPNVCGLISEMIYEGELKSAPNTVNQRLPGSKSNKMVPVETGIVFYPVEHYGRSQSCDEEVAVIKNLVAELKTRSYTDKDGKNVGFLTDDDILIVAPYNMQVNKLTEALGSAARVGTVDKFQGQEAPVVILSMCASDLESVPRGIDFLLSKNRINVALSRAKCLAVVVGSPEIASAYVGGVEAMRLVNLYCRILGAA